MNARALVASARARGLAATATIIDGFAYAALLDTSRLPADARVGEAPHTLGKALLQQMARRGHDPALVRALWRWLDGRPLERALVAVDVAARSLVDDALGTELGAAAATLGALVTRGEPGVDLNAHPGATLVDRFARDPALDAQPTADLLALSYDFHLGAIDALARRRDPILRQPATHESLRAFGRLLHLAHLPTLASVYLDVVSRPLGYRAAALDLCEALFDARVPAKIPGDAIRPGDLRAGELEDTAEYLVYRMNLALADPRSVYALARDNQTRRDLRLGAPRDRLAVVLAHLALVAGDRAQRTLERVAAAVARDKTWRYAAHVHAVAAAAERPPESNEPLELVHDFVTGFGVDAALFREVAAVVPPSAPLRAGLVTLAAREAATLPHEREAWRALVLLIAGARGAEPALGELRS